MVQGEASVFGGLHIDTGHLDERHETEEVDASTDGDSFFSRATKMLSGSLSQRAQLQRTKSWGTSLFRQQFQDVDMLESGYAREYITEECLSPTTFDKTWLNCIVERVDKTEYRLYEDNTNRFLLSAKQVGDDFYISQYEDFPLIDGVPQMNFCAVLRRTENSTTNFKLYNCGCEGCDKGFMTFTCGLPGTEHGGADRQMLADITHSTKRIKQVDADMRNFKVVMPAVLSDKKSRVVWCPRQNGSDTPTGSTPRSSTKRHFVSSPSPSHHHVRSFDEANLQDDRLVLQSKLPEWNPELSSLVLKFHGGRVLAASSKNFMMATADQPNRGVLQFGKNRKGRFVLDFRHPMAPIQAFGICLSACAWAVEE